jgi:hypothetical protein
VRFFIRDPDTNVIQYSFNTKIHKITIAPALQPDLNADITVDTSTDLLALLQDSPSSNTPPAAIPTFAEPGLNLPTELDINDN